MRTLFLALLTSTLLSFAAQNVRAQPSTCPPNSGDSSLFQETFDALNTGIALEYFESGVQQTKQVSGLVCTVFTPNNPYYSQNAYCTIAPNTNTNIVYEALLATTTSRQINSDIIRYSKAAGAISCILDFSKSLGYSTYSSCTMIQ